MKTYKITGKTNGWIAQRDSLFKGKERIIMERHLSLLEAQKTILDFFNRDYDTCYKNWGLVRCNSDMAYSHSDGTRGYEYDSRYYEIEEEVEPSIFKSEDNDGNCIYIGSSKEDAINAIIESDDIDVYRLFGDEEVIWDGMFETKSELKELL